MGGKLTWNVKTAVKYTTQKIIHFVLIAGQVKKISPKKNIKGQ